MKAGAPLLISVIALGAVVRWAGGVPLLHTDLAMSPEASGLPEAGAAGGAPANAAGPEAAAMSFYSCLQRGDYGNAWRVSLEPDWAGAASATYQKEVEPSASAVGWTTETDFVRRCADDIGSGIKLNAVRVVRLPAPPDSPESRAVSALGATHLFGVRASGHMLGACMIYRWERDLVVADVGGRYRVVLPGTKAARASFHQDWFSRLSLVGSLRSPGR
jgi:hypothetical protein